MPTKTTKTSPNGAKKKPQANKLPKFGDQVLELLRERLSAIETNVGLTHAAVLALQESSAKPADPPPAEKWVVGEWVEVTGECGKGGSRRLVGVVGQLECKWPNEFLNPAWIIKGTGSWFAQKNLRLLSPAEIAEHKRKEEWAKITELQEGDAVRCIPSTQHELMELARLGGVPKLDDEKAPNLRWENWSTSRGSMLIETVDPEDYSKKAKPLNWLPFDEFKRRLLGTIARLKSEAEARELAMPLEFGTRVKVKGREEENWRIACDEPTDDGYWRLAPPKCGNLNTMTAKRSEFTIIP